MKLVKILISIVIIEISLSYFSIVQATNNWVSNPIVIDTTEDKTGTFNVTKIEWHPSAANDDLLITDSLGNTLVKRRAIAAASNGESYAVETINLNRNYINGLYITTLDGGTIYIFQGKTP